jgi:hypothetical protein
MNRHEAQAPLKFAKDVQGPRPHQHVQRAGLLVGDEHIWVERLLFVLGVARGVQGTRQALAFRVWVRLRLAPPSELEDPRPHASPNWSDCGGGDQAALRSTRFPRRGTDPRRVRTRGRVFQRGFLACASAASSTRCSAAGTLNTKWEPSGC